MELILYYIMKNSSLIISFLIFMLVFGILFFLYIRKFNQNKKKKVIIYGLFLQMKNLDILKISTLLIKFFVVIFAIFINDNIVLFTCFMIIAILSIMYIVLFFRRVFHEIICTIIQIAILYVIFIVNTYAIEIENSLMIMFILSFMIIFEIFFTAYLFFKEIDIISRRRLEKVNLQERNENNGQSKQENS